MKSSLMLRVMVVLLVLCGVVAFAHAQALPGGLGGLGGLGGGGAPASTPVTSKVAISNQAIPAGGEGRIAVEISINSRYHIQSAFAPKPYIPASVTPKPLTGITFGAARYPVAKDIPAPEGLRVGGQDTLSVYEGKVYLIVPVKVAPDAAVGDVELEVVVRTQACDDKSCDPPKNTTLKVPLKILPGGSAATGPSDAGLIEAADSQKYSAVSPGTGPAATSGVATKPVAQGTWAGGIPLMNEAAQLAAIDSRDYHPANKEELTHSLGAVIVFALLGGVILNVMPCVLPVIPLKVLSLVQQAHGDRKLAVMHGITFSAGVITLFVALAVLLRGFGLFYGQQFQSPIFLIAMTYFVVALALSMVGVWTINPPQAVYNIDSKISAGTQGPGHGQTASAYLGSFSNGLMATVLATPCSAPFLGGVLAWALVQPMWLAAFALALVGVGMSAPYLILAAFPQLLNKLPRAGRWSELLKQGLGIVMLGVGVYLITLIPNVRLWGWVAMGGVIVSLVCWAWGQVPSLEMTLGRIWAIRSIAVSVGIALGTGLLMVAMRVSTAPAAPRGSDGVWEPFNVALLDAALAEGRPVVVDWTADWCINCHVLEAVVLSKENVQDAFKRKNVLLLRADLSADNPPATALNRKLGSESIPVLAIFSPERKTTPVVLRDSYSTTRVIEEVEKAR